VEDAVAGSPQEPDDRALLAALAPYGESHEFAAGHRFHAPQDAADALFLLQRGMIRIYTLSAEGRALTLFLHSAPAIFGELALLGVPVHDVFAEAFNPVTVLRVPREQVRSLMRQDSALGLGLLDLLGRRLRAMEAKLAEIAFKSVPQRLAGVLVALADPAEPGRGSASVLRLTHQQLAEMVGTYRETVTKTLGELRESGLIRIDDDVICLLDVEQLRRLAEARISRAG
jgi:CRP/FNR family transcriptional regulator, cyclic AMP receptor protein